MQFIEHFLAAASLFVVIDGLWLKTAKPFYEKQIGDLLKPKPDLLAAAIFYILYMIGVLVFALDPALGRNSFSYAIGRGALLGLLMYATYDLTNRATLKRWPAKLVLVDMVWGAFITAAVTTLSFVIFRS